MTGVSQEFELAGFLIVLVTAGVIFAVSYAWRWNRRRWLVVRAQSWPRTDATVNSSCELDESSAVLSRSSLGVNHDNVENIQLWSTAIQYTYHVNGDIYAGTYCLPSTSEDGHDATEAGRAWIGKKIVVRYNPDHPEESVFLQQDGAPGESRISRLVSDRHELTTLSLK